MLRKKLREREAYLRSKEVQRDTDDKKRRLQESLQTNTRIPHDLREDAKGLLDEMIYGTEIPEAIHPPPKVAVTTSHSPSSSLKSFSKHISLVLNGLHLMRGGLTETELSDYCQSQGVTHLIIFKESKGNPSSMVLCKYGHGPTYHFSLFNVKFQRRAKSMGEKAYLVVDGMDSEVGQRLKSCLSLCFPKVPEASRLVAFINRNGTVAFRHFLIESRKLVKECEFDMRLFKVVNSTFDTNGDVDFALKAFMNSANNDVLAEKK